MQRNFGSPNLTAWDTYWHNFFEYIKVFKVHDTPSQILVLYTI